MSACLFIECCLEPRTSAVRRARWKAQTRLNERASSGIRGANAEMRIRTAAGTHRPKCASTRTLSPRATAAHARRFDAVMHPNSMCRKFEACDAQQVSGRTDQARLNRLSKARALESPLRADPWRGVATDQTKVEYRWRTVARRREGSIATFGGRPVRLRHTS